MAEPEFQDLIIIKRRLSTEPEMPKGGVWKIAFADFMTAMMCFFLVMWLINAANEDTRKAVASYFNPIRLAELNRKGVENPHNQSTEDPTTGEKTREDAKPGKAPPPEPSADISRDALFKDPYKILAEIAGAPAPGGAGAGPGGAETGSGGVFRDLFDPEFRQSLGDGAKADAAAAVSAASESPASAPPAGGQPGTGPDAAAMSAPAEQGPAAPDPMPMLRPAERGSADPDQERADLQSELAQAVARESSAAHAPKVAVERTGEGTVISLTDDVEFGMFGIGSAEPQPQMIRIMERIAAILKTHGGSITIRGHTDARPFKNGSYDNWRLSTDRAQMAYYMLVRGGLDEKRVDAIEGYADRKLKVPGDPEAAGNRRIEILLREASS